MQKVNSLSDRFVIQISLKCLIAKVLESLIDPTVFSPINPNKIFSRRGFIIKIYFKLPAG